MDANSDQRRDVENYLEAMVREASRQADLAIAFLDALPWMPPLAQRQHNPVALSADLLLKIGALMRIYQWEKTGLRPQLPTNLPPAQAVLEDVMGPPAGAAPRYSGTELAQAVMQVYLRHLAWKGLTGLQADVAVAACLPAEQAVDALAAFLWQFRHLASKENPA